MNLGMQLARLAEREQDAARRGDWQTARKLSDEAREVREAIQCALRPNSIRSRDEVRNDLSTPDSFAEMKRRRAYEQLVSA